MALKVWDYHLPKNWKPKTPAEWQWFLVRKINYGNWEGLTKKDIKKWYPKIKHLLDPGKRAMLEEFLNQ